MQTPLLVFDRGCSYLAQWLLIVCSLHKGLTLQYIQEAWWTDLNKFSTKKYTFWSVLLKIYTVYDVPIFSYMYYRCSNAPNYKLLSI